MLIRGIRHRWWRGWILVLFLLFILFWQSAARRSANDPSSRRTASQTRARQPATRPSFSWKSGASTSHPISTLMDDAKVAFTKRLARQSKTLPEAVSEYRRRYGRDPPRGFDDWWEFAQENDFKLVDEFDAIVEDLAPFWELSGEELRRRTFEAGHLPSIDLMHIEDGEVYEVLIEKDYVDVERGQRFLGVLSLIEKFMDKLPDIDIAINTKAEGRVLVPWEHLRYPNLTQQDLFASMLGNFTFDWQEGGNVWEAYRRTCSPVTPARQLYGAYRNPMIQERNVLLGQSRNSHVFALTVDDEFDFCENPWARYTQGHFFSDWRTIPVLYPVFSPSKAKGFADIRIPSHYYHRGSKDYTYGWDPTYGVIALDDMEVPWDEKSEKIFWRGATTGGGNTPPGFSPTYQRHRFLRMAHESALNNITIVHALPSQPDTFISTILPAKDVNNDIMDVAFVSVVGTYPGGEPALRKHHRISDWVPLGRHWSYKYLIDLDGMSYSARFMGFLASDSAVLKSTIYKEFWSHWIQPWLHYIPISSSYSEIYDVHAYFSGPSTSTLDAANQTVENPADWEAVRKERDGRLREIATAGKQWKNTIGRTVDMEVYAYRLFLEYARLWADDRDSMNFVL